MTRPGTRPFVSLLTDFGPRDPSAGICRAVVLGIAPDALVVDITHDVRKFAVRDGALLLWCAVPYLPIGAHVAVVDPGVGTDRRGIAIETARGDHLVGPDNGLLVPAAARLGGIVRVHTLENPQYRLPVITSSFHGRDIFSPGAAHLAMGVPLEFLGPAVDPRTLVLLDWPEPEVYDGLLRSSILYLDTFGNVKLSALGGHMLNAFGGLREGESLYVRIEDDAYSRDLRVPWVGTFGRVPVGQALVYEDSYGRLCLAVNQGSAVATLGLRQDMNVTITRSPLPGGARAGEGVTVPAWSPPPTLDATFGEPGPEPLAEPRVTPTALPTPEPDPPDEAEPEPDSEPSTSPEPESNAELTVPPKLDAVAAASPEPTASPEPDAELPADSVSAADTDNDAAPGTDEEPTSATTTSRSRRRSQATLDEGASSSGP